jgi:uncharacterized membrane protein (UPF0136 family)
MGGLEILAISTLVGGVLGFFLRGKKIKPIIGILLGLTGAIIMGYLLTEILFKSFLAIPVYAIFGSWLFNFIIAKVKK